MNERSKSKSKNDKNRRNIKNDLEFEAETSFNKIQELKAKKKVFTKTDFDKCGIELTPKQHQLYKTIRNNILTVVQGPAGTAKTFVACYTALGLLADGKVNKIIITKPIVDAGESIGYLPGSVDEKVAVYMKSYISTFEKILGKFMTEVLISSGIIEINLLAYMRGDTFDNSIMILDECQNVLISQLMLWATRLGKNSYACMCGDVSQYDIKEKDAKFLQFIKFTDGMKEVANFKFEKEDIVRNKFLIELTDRYERWKYSDKS